MKSVVKSVVTVKSGLTHRNHCENPIKGERRVEDIPLYITNSRNCEYSQILASIFLVTTEMTTVSEEPIKNAAIPSIDPETWWYVIWSRGPPKGHQPSL
jgi:hypothetical protein